MLHCFGCGKDLPDNLAYCLYCGARLDDDDETVVNPTPAPRPIPYEPIPYEQKRGSGVGKFILGSLLGAFLVIALVAVGGFVLFSVKNGEVATNQPVLNANADSPTPQKTQSSKIPTPSAVPSRANNNIATGPARQPERECFVTSGDGGTANLRRNCDTRDCSTDPTTLYTEADSGDLVTTTARSPVTTGRVTWVQGRDRGEGLWISSTRIECD
jgi:hypothetical protein